jgi:hypothetical protein
MEYVGYQPNTVHVAVHTSSGFGGLGNGRSSALEFCEEAFHNYGVSRTEKHIDYVRVYQEPL